MCTCIAEVAPGHHILERALAVARRNLAVEQEEEVRSDLKSSIFSMKSIVLRSTRSISLVIDHLALADHELSLQDVQRHELGDDVRNEVRLAVGEEGHAL